MILKVDRRVLPVPFGELAKVLEHGTPVSFSGQRTPIYQLGERLFLKAKGFAFRKRVYSEYEKYTLTQRLPISTELARQHELQMQHYGRPQAVQFLEESGDYEFPVAQPDGSIHFERSAPRPIAAMRCGNAELEYYMHYYSKQAGLPVDLPLGYAEFPEFGFIHNGQHIPCGGYLCLIPTPYDLRIPEILHLARNQSIADMYGIQGLNPAELLLHSLTEAGVLLRRFHSASMTLSTPHFLNFKFGLLDYDLVPRMRDPAGSPLVSICDLDNAQIEPNQGSSLMYLCNMIRDLEELCLFAYYFFVSRRHRQKVLKDKLGDDQRCMCALSALLPMELGLEQIREPLHSIFAGYFGLPATHPVLSLLMPTLETFKKNLKRKGDPLLSLLKALHASRLTPE